MSVESFIQAMPKVDLSLRLEGALEQETLLMIAEQNDIQSTFKTSRQYQQWLNLVKEPDYSKLEEIARTIAGWLQYPEDLARVVYELGVFLSKQNVRYAEVSVIPALYTDLGMSFEEFLDAINDGRDKVLRGWQVRMDWLVAIPRDRPRKGDDISRWAVSAAARKGNVVGMTLVGQESVQPVGQFKRAFSAVEKRELSRACHAMSEPTAEALSEILDTVNPNRVNDFWLGINDEAALAMLAEREVAVVVTPSRELRLGRIGAISEYPLTSLMNHVLVSVGSGMPMLYKTTLSDELNALLEIPEVEIDDIRKLILNNIEASFLNEEDKASYKAEFISTFDALHEEHLVIN